MSNIFDISTGNRISVKTLTIHDSKDSFQEEIDNRRRDQNITENMVLEHVDADIDQFYAQEKHVLGTGISTVRSCVHRTTGRRFALKTINKRNKTLPQLRSIGEEIRIMASLDHPNIVRLYETFETPSEIYLVMELLTGGDLLERLTTVGHELTEELTNKIIQEILSSVRYCHDHGIVHRDVKLENFVFESNMSNALLKMIDFGESTRMCSGEVIKDSHVSAYYVAPEVLTKTHNEKCDIWSVGVIAYMLLTGVPPFDGRRDADILKAVRNGVASYPPDLFGHVTKVALDFVRRCLTYDASRRPSAEEAQRHPWFLSMASYRMQQPLPTTMISRLKAFRQKNALQRLCLEAVAYALTTEELTTLRAEFDKFDVNNTGSISLETLRQVFEASGTLNLEEIDEIFRGIDFEGNGTISYRELVAAMITNNGQNEDNLKLAFDRMAHHKDHITYQDIRDLLGKDFTDDDTDRMLLEFKYDRNAGITFNDFKRIMRGTQRAQMSSRRGRSNVPPQVRRGSRILQEDGRQTSGMPPRSRGGRRNSDSMCTYTPSTPRLPALITSLSARERERERSLPDVLPDLLLSNTLAPLAQTPSTPKPPNTPGKKGRRHSLATVDNLTPSTPRMPPSDILSPRSSRKVISFIPDSSPVSKQSPLLQSPQTPRPHTPCSKSLRTGRLAHVLPDMDDSTTVNNPQNQDSNPPVEVSFMTVFSRITDAISSQITQKKSGNMESSQILEKKSGSMQSSMKDDGNQNKIPAAPPITKKPVGFLNSVFPI